MKSMKKVHHRATVAGEEFEFERGRVEEVARSLEAESIRDHFVVVGGIRFPPKQILQAMTGLDRADFTTNQARAVLKRLGFETGRKSSGSAVRASSAGEAAEPYHARQADPLRAHRGRWVAVRDGDVLAVADDPEQLYAWLVRHDATAESMFRVPLDPEADIGSFAS